MAVNDWALGLVVFPLMTIVPGRWISAAFNFILCDAVFWLFFSLLFGHRIDGLAAVTGTLPASFASIDAMALCV